MLCLWLVRAAGRPERDTGGSFRRLLAGTQRASGGGARSARAGARLLCCLLRVQPPGPRVRARSLPTRVRVARVYGLWHWRWRAASARHRTPRRCSSVQQLLLHPPAAPAPAPASLPWTLPHRQPRPPTCRAPKGRSLTSLGTRLPPSGPRGAGRGGCCRGEGRPRTEHKWPHLYHL
uniref:Uncharacterized protein n=1 Tax=Mus musculus TaxID=10090 RepID=Q9D367_MOUSE|nr:unnamed protein product [Mus musculus]